MLIPSRSPSFDASHSGRSRSRSLASSSSSSGSGMTIIPGPDKYPYQPFGPDPSFQIPPTGNWHRRNPHRDHTPPPAPPAIQTQPRSPGGRAMTPTEPDVPQPMDRAWTPTEIVDDDEAAANAPRRAPAAAAPQRRTSARLANALSSFIGAAPTTTITPLLETFGRLCVTIYETREENLQAMCERAMSAGMYSDAVPIPAGVAKMGSNGSGSEPNTWFIASGSPSRVAAVRRKLLWGGPAEEEEEEDVFGRSASFRASRNHAATASRKGKEREFVPDEIYTPGAAPVASTSGTTHQAQPAQAAQETQPQPPQVQVIINKYAYDVSARAVVALISILFAAFLLYAALWGMPGAPGAGVLRK